MDDLVAHAARLAAERHKEQRRKDGVTPYIVHPQRVAQRLAEAGVRRPEVIAAAWLHDVIEDTEGTYAEIHDAFGADVADIVEAVTRRSGVSRREFTERLYECRPDALLVRMADRLDNLEDWSGMPAGFRRPYMHEARRMVHWSKQNPWRSRLQDEEREALHRLEALVRRASFRES